MFKEIISISFENYLYVSIIIFFIARVSLKALGYDRKVLHDSDYIPASALATVLGLAWAAVVPVTLLYLLNWSAIKTGELLATLFKLKT